MSDALNDREFYDLMQAYRNTPISHQVAVSEAYEDVKTYIREKVVAGIQTELDTAKAFIAEHVGVEPETQRDFAETN